MTDLEKLIIMYGKQMKLVGYYGDHLAADTHSRTAANLLKEIRMEVLYLQQRDKSIIKKENE